MFNRSEILRKAWSDYRRDIKKGWGQPTRARFAYCLKMAWAVAKDLAARAAKVVQSEPVSKLCADPIRAEAIRSELRDMELASDFIDWTARANLGAELAQLHR